MNPPLPHQRREYEQALQEYNDLHRQIESLNLNGVPKTHYEGPSYGQGAPSSNAQGYPARNKPSHVSAGRPQDVNPPRASFVPKYAMPNPDTSYLNAPAQNPYYAPPQKGPRVSPRPNYPQPSTSAGKYAISDGLPVIKIRGYGRSTPPPSSQAIVYQVQFKRSVRHYVPGPRCPPLLSVGEFVIVQCTRGENLGVVTEIMTMQQLQIRRYENRSSGEEPEEGEGNLSQIVRVANRLERQALVTKHTDEVAAIQVRLGGFVCN